MPHLTFNHPVFGNLLLREADGALVSLGRESDAKTDAPTPLLRRAAEAGGSARAVGGANRNNPIPILIPCHRVCAANGLGGYAGSNRPGRELDMKRRLPELEGALQAPPLWRQR
ncbi:MAG TPA: MGMT family protein [Acidiphilium sp.]